jgi:hypothetical protein
MGSLKPSEWGSSSLGWSGRTPPPLPSGSMGTHSPSAHHQSRPHPTQTARLSSSGVKGSLQHGLEGYWTISSSRWQAIGGFSKSSEGDSLRTSRTLANIGLCSSKVLVLLRFSASRTYEHGFPDDLWTKEAAPWTTRP